MAGEIEEERCPVKSQWTSKEEGGMNEHGREGSLISKLYGYNGR